MAYFKEPLCSEQLILTDEMIKDMVSSILAEMSKVCCVGGKYKLPDGMSMIEKIREEFALRFSEAHDIPITQVPGLDALIGGMLKSFEGACLGPYKPIVGLIQGVMNALKCPPKAPKRLKSMLVALLCYLERMAKDFPKELAEAAILETIGEFAEKAMIPIPQTEYMVKILLGKLTIDDFLEMSKDEVVGQETPEGKANALRKYWILPSALDKILTYTLPVFDKKDLMQVAYNEVENMDFGFDMFGMKILNGSFQTRCIADMIVTMLSLKFDKCYFEDKLKELKKSFPDIYEDILKNVELVKGFTFKQLLEIIKTPLNVAKGIIETIICWVKKIIKNPIKAIKEVLKIIKNPVEWVFGFMKDAIVAALGTLLKSVFNVDAVGVQAITTFLEAMIAKLLENAPFKFPSLNELCSAASKALDEFIERQKAKIDEIVMLKINGAMTLLTLMIAILKAVLSIILCIPKLLAWLFGKFRKKKTQEMDEEERLALLEEMEVPFEAMNIMMLYENGKTANATNLTPGTFGFNLSGDIDQNYVKGQKAPDCEKLDSRICRPQYIDVFLGETSIDPNSDEPPFDVDDIFQIGELVDIITYWEADDVNDDDERKDVFAFTGHISYTSKLKKKTNGDDVTYVDSVKPSVKSMTSKWKHDPVSREKTILLVAKVQKIENISGSPKLRKDRLNNVFRIYLGDYVKTNEYFSINAEDKIGLLAHRGADFNKVC